ncbi:hypothetical protein AGRI_03629 [Alishewanella agri BL06]|uniref:DUF445 domain-containing protein n=1 Tax=Alishewanella agri BL06 TaxID=1195246 RepID=I9P4N8_9ALTE|nr:hypothetical protein [Alishewanella agri]EIW89952.1 hypothetical protein AGRI_03629 [Alishewanella agri BL06]OZB40299.1 MAG: DUF445 domain-containing protein [Alishewanella sp. 34-51-39]
MNKNVLTNVIALLLTISGWALAEPLLLNIGLFALAGAITNTLAIHMLFERVPLLYGSGVIPARFAEFRLGIQQLVMSEFFNQANIARFIDSQKPQRQTFDFEPVLAEVDLSLAFRALQKAVEQSSLGAMLAMFGGSAVLQPLEQPFTDKLRGALLQIAASDDFQQLLLKQLHNSSQLDALQQQIEQIVQQRLHELTPELVKDIIQRMIRQHLGWLVVWGGVFGGLLGLMAGLLTL